MSFLPILIIFGVLFFISPSYYVYKISHGSMNSSDFPLFYLIMVLTLSLWWLVIGIKEDRIQGDHFVIGLLGTVFLNIWIVNYNLAGSHILVQRNREKARSQTAYQCSV